MTKELSQIPLLSRKLLFGNPDKASPNISPDGSRLAYLAPKDGVLNVWVGSIDNIQDAEPVTNDTVRGIRMFAWTYTGDHILYLQDKGGDENWRIYSADVNSKKTIDLTPFENVQAQVANISSNFPTEIMVLLNNRNPELHDLYKVNVVNGERELVFENKEGFAELYVDDNYELRFSARMMPSGGSMLYQQIGGEWKTFMEIPMSDSLTTSLAGFNHKGDVVYLNNSIGRNTSGLFKVNLENGQRTLLAEDEKTDMGTVFIHSETKEALAIEKNFERKEWIILDESIKDDFEYLKSVEEGEFAIINTTADFSKWVVIFHKDDGPAKYYLYTPAEKKSEFLFTNRTELEGVLLSDFQSAVIKTRDGYDMVCYYTLPPNYKGQKKPDKPLPTVLFVHGGPWGRDEWGFNSYHQWMANRGYVCLSMNFRGSTGFGKEFLNAGNLEWAGKMHDDVIDAMKWAVDEGIADPDKVAITGGSYGGYSTLVGLTFTPDTFACGVDIVGPSNLVTLLESVPPYWKPMLELFYKRMGDNRTEEGREFLLSRSPLTKVNEIKKPLLIAQGANDPRVKQAESDQIVKAMQEKNIPVSYVLFPDEGHGFRRPENMISFSAVTEAFLAKILGGRYQEIGDDFKGSTITVPVGASIVPGLEEKLD